MNLKELEQELLHPKAELLAPEPVLRLAFKDKKLARKLARMKVPDDATDFEIRLAWEALEVITQIMHREIPAEQATMAFRAACRIREEICGAPTAKAQNQAAPPMFNLIINGIRPPKEIAVNELHQLPEVASHRQSPTTGPSRRFTKEGDLQPGKETSNG